MTLQHLRELPRLVAAYLSKCVLGKDVSRLCSPLLRSGSQRRLGRELLVHDMATMPEAQGRGHASTLIVALTQIAQQNGCGRVFVHTRKAQQLYRRNGFEEYSTGMVKKLPISEA